MSSIMDEQFSKEEAERRALENLRRMIATPPVPKKGKKPAKSPSRDAKPRKRGRSGEAS